jgi:hypothetical protein
VTGDFFQLPPVNKGGEPNFVFEAETWKEAIHKSINLTKVFRQRDESELDSSLMTRGFLADKLLFQSLREDA